MNFSLDFFSSHLSQLAFSLGRHFGFGFKESNYMQKVNDYKSATLYAYKIERIIYIPHREIKNIIEISLPFYSPPNSPPTK
jgi:hypothetical protein